MAEFDEDSDYDSWDDITPVPQEDGSVVVIDYNPDYRGMMNIFRAVIRNEEYSERVLRLTEKLLDANPANYTVWQYRRECLRNLGLDLELELDFMDQFADNNPKNYQIWYHRRAIVEMMGKAPRELAFCEKVFQVDGKNYHAWAHRQWVLETFDLFE